MNDYFNLIATEFAAQSAQIKQFVKSHGPSIGAAHEILLRSFLKKYLPKWVSVGHGFIIDKGNSLSKECDVLIYNSLYYSPLYQIEDFLVLAPESVIAVIEVKSGLNKKMLHDSICNLGAVKTINPDIDVSLFVYRPPSLNTIFEYIQSYDFSEMKEECIPDRIYGMSKYALERVTFYDSKGEKPAAIGYLTKGSYAKPKVGFVFESFYYDLYVRVEAAINDGIKSGINYNWIAKIDEENNPPVITHGRSRYATPKVLGFAPDSRSITVKKFDV